MSRSSSAYATEHRLKGLLTATAGVVVLSFDAALVRLAEASGWDIVFWRGLLMAVSVSALLLMTQGRYTLRIWRRGGWAAAASGLSFGLNAILFVFAVLHTHAANVLVLFATAPLFSALFT
ncbi:MAG: EamA/RhaT family transporter, partial [Halorhodospira sp.]